MKTIKQMTALAGPLAAAMALAGLATIGLTGCDDANSKTAQAQGAPQGGPPVSAAAVVEKTLTETQEFSGRLEAIEQVQIRPRVAGFITAINFKPGSQVKKGDVLFVIDARPFQAEANRARLLPVRPVPRPNWPSWNSIALKSCWPIKPSPSANSTNARRTSSSSTPTPAPRKPSTKQPS
ncbi:hypothetical protein J2X54_003820 [Duganella sp. 3397]|nr:hypothetical protein [Duganella sp. 3397]